MKSKRIKYYLILVVLTIVAYVIVRKFWPEVPIRLWGAAMFAVLMTFILAGVELFINVMMDDVGKQEEKSAKRRISEKEEQLNHEVAKLQKINEKLKEKEKESETGITEAELNYWKAKKISQENMVSQAEKRVSEAEKSLKEQKMFNDQVRYYANRVAKIAVRTSVVIFVICTIVTVIVIAVG